MKLSYNDFIIWKLVKENFKTLYICVFFFSSWYRYMQVLFLLNFVKFKFFNDNYEIYIYIYIFLDPSLFTVRQNFHVRLEIHVEDICLALKDWWLSKIWCVFVLNDMIPLVVQQGGCPQVTLSICVKLVHWYNPSHLRIP